MKLTPHQIETIERTLEKGNRVEIVPRTDKPVLILKIKRTEAK